MIYFDIQHHGPHVTCLPTIEFLSHRECSLHISIDSKQRHFQELQEQLASTEFKHTSLSRSPEISWGGISIVHQVIQAMERALKISGWEFFVTMSGSCIPIKPVHIIQANLRRKLHDDGTLGYISQFQIQKPIPHLPPLHLSGLTDEYRSGRATIQGDATLINFLKQGTIRPTTEASHRKCFRFREVGKNRFQISLPAEQISNPIIYAGRQWAILHRNIVEWLISDDIARSVANELDGMFIPDEHFFQTALLSKRNPFKSSVRNTNMWYRGGGPQKLSETDFLAACEGPAFFARKFHPEISSVVKKVLDYV